MNIPVGGMEGTMVSQDFRKQLEGYGLTTANILYRRPDHPWLLQTFVWQDLRFCVADHSKGRAFAARSRRDIGGTFLARKRHLKKI